MSKTLTINSKWWLQGDIRKLLSVEERGVFIDLLALANESSERGVICRAKGIPYTMDYLSTYLNTDSQLIELTIAKCINREIISNDKYGCFVVNSWNKYNV